MTFEIVPAEAVPLAQQALILNKVFAGYLAGWVDLDDAALARFLCAQGADLCYSRFCRTGGALVAVGYVNRTANISRLAGMGTISDARRTGVARFLLTHLLEQATERRDEAMMLEVFEQNLAAHSLYRSAGFHEQGRLFGWRRPADAPSIAHLCVDIDKVPARQLLNFPNAYEYPELPWQISRQAIIKLPVAHFFAGEEAIVVVGDTEQPTIRVHGFFSAKPDWTACRRILAAIVSMFPKREFFAPAIFPKNFAHEIFEPLQFKREPLNQFLMQRDL